MKSRPGLALAVAGLSLAGCVSISDTYAPPMDRRPVTGYAESSFGGVVSMNDSSALAHIVRDVSPQLQSGAWRWTLQRPELRFLVSRAKGVRMVMDFVVPKLTFDATGPVTISFYVNERLLDKVRYDQPGDKHFEKPVPPDWLITDRMNTVAAEIDKLYVAPQDGAKVGFILNRAGLAE